jgi:superoxide reductase
MQERRDFLKASIVLAAGAAVGASGNALAATGTIPDNIIYTAGSPGKWSAKVGSHAPVISRSGNTITVATNHPMSEIHYIVRHTLISEKGTVIGAMTFVPDDEKAVSTYQLPDNVGSKIYATSFCNKHDFWMTEFTL